MVAAAGLTFSSCSDDARQQNEHSNKPDGLPVVTEQVKPRYFKKELTYYSTLTGIIQNTSTSAVGGRIEKINYRVGDFVRKDDVVVEFPTDNPSIQYEQAKHAYDNSKKNYERMKALLDAGETSQANFDGIETKYLVDKRNFEMAKQALFIDAPFDGYIVEIMVNEGDGVDSKIPLFTLAKIDRMKTKVWASESEVKQIRKGMKSFAAFDGKVIEGKVADLSQAIDLRRRAYYAEIEFFNPEKILNPGTVTEIKIQVYVNENALVVPMNLIRDSAGKKILFINNNGFAAEKVITTGLSNGLEIEILSGIQAGDLLIVKGSNILVDGQKVYEVQ